jgi:hypothetical protein
MAPMAVVCSVVVNVFARASRGWKVACWSAMAGGMGVNVVLRALQTSMRLVAMSLASKTR